MQLPHMELHYIRRSITGDVASTITACIAGTRLDYCNALLHDATEMSVNKLQRAKHKPARVVCTVTTRQQHTVDSPSLSALASHQKPHYVQDRHKVYGLSQLSYLFVTLEPHVRAVD